MLHFFVNFDAGLFVPAMLIAAVTLARSVSEDAGR